MRILFAYYPLAVHWNHATRLLAEVCRNKGIVTTITELTDIEDFVKTIIKTKPNFIGFSFVTEDDYKLSLPFIHIADSFDCIDLLAGGVYCKTGGRVDESLFQHICRGEGENLPDFLLHSDITVFNNYYHENLDNLPLPDYYGISGYEFSRPKYGFTFLNGLKIIPYSSSRGCPYSCSFCDIQFFKHKVRIKHTLNQDLDFLTERFNQDLIYFTDELMPYYNDEWENQITKNTFPFMGMIRADIKKDDLLLLIENGLKFCAFGVESGDEGYRNAVLKKNLYDRDIYNTVDILRQKEITFAPFYMENTPNETGEIRGKTEKMRIDLGGWPVTFSYKNLVHEKKQEVLA